MEFVDAGHDLILAADASASDLIREIASECGVDFDEVALYACFAYIFFLSISHNFTLIGGVRLLAPGLDKPSSFCLYPLFVLEHPFDMYKY